MDVEMLTLKTMFTELEKSVEIVEAGIGDLRNEKFFIEKTNISDITKINNLNLSIELLNVKIDMMNYLRANCENHAKNLNTIISTEYNDIVANINSMENTSDIDEFILRVNESDSITRAAGTKISKVIILFREYVDTINKLIFRVSNIVRVATTINFSIGEKNAYTNYCNAAGEIYNPTIKQVVVRM